MKLLFIASIAASLINCGVKVAEGKSVVVHAGIENDFKVTAEQLEKAITPKTKLIIFSTPCNPTGSVYSKEELKSWAEVLQRHPNVGYYQ